ncbi:RING finger and SPRY domain-containing protein 1 [Papilio xuthus]|uniref:RING finger and SPRY domain-containing protein 1 n=1 Tax=Papilio xuthus TaxID=66420 RepID=A0A194PLC7_PAPXU|nr:RING finger and SPRY domain-containing protein 1 [Papilio xuthus]
MHNLMNHLNDYEYLRRKRPNGIWERRYIRNVIFQMLRKLRPYNTVPQELDLMVRYIVHISLIETNWLTVASILMDAMPTCPYTKVVIALIIRNIPSPNAYTVSTLLNDRFHLSQRRAVAASIPVRVEKNICIVLNCLAEKLVGTNSTVIFTDNVCSYLCHIFINSRYHNDLELQMRALLALEKISVIRENKTMIVQRLELLNSNHLSGLEKYLTNIAGEEIRREVGYCARWALDNIFPKPGRQLSYDTVDLSAVNCMFKNESGNIYIKYSPDLMEIRNDTICPQTLHGTSEVDGGLWFYEVKLITDGSITVGWGSTGADTEISVGDEERSLGYEGNKMTFWYHGKAYGISLTRWRADDVLGCLLDSSEKTISFFLHGAESSITCFDFFSPSNTPKKYFPAITMTAFQQCEVNFGQVRFRSAPVGSRFDALNTVGHLTPQQRMVICVLIEVV